MGEATGRRHPPEALLGQGHRGGGVEDGDLAHGMGRLQEMHRRLERVQNPRILSDIILSILLLWYLI